MNLLEKHNLYRLCLLSFTLILTGACGKRLGAGIDSENHAVFQGEITFQGKPVSGARVYAYEAPEFLEEAQRDNSRIEDILRAEVQDIDDLPIEEMAEDESMGIAEEWEDTYPEFRGPADYKSAVTGTDGRYYIILPSGRYCLAARKRDNAKVQVGPLTPEDYSSLLSRPIVLGAGEVAEENFKLEKLIEPHVNFGSRYTIKTKGTEIKGVIIGNNQPLAGFYVTADRQRKVTNKPDFYSEPSDENGKYTLYLPGSGIYYLSLRATPMGKALPGEIVSEYVNRADNSLEIIEGELIEDVQVIFLPDP